MKRREKIELLIPTTAVFDLDHMEERDKEKVVEAVNEVQRQLNLPKWRRTGWEEVARLDNDDPFYSVQVGPYTVMVMQGELGWIVTQVMHLVPQMLMVYDNQKDD